MKQVKRCRKKKKSPYALARLRKRHKCFLVKKIAGKPGLASPEGKSVTARVEGTKNAEHVNMQSEGPTSGIRNGSECRGINGMETDTQLIDKQRAKGVAVNISSSNTLRNNSDVTSENYNDTNIASKGSNEKEVWSKNRHQSFLRIPGLQSEPPDPIQAELTMFQSIRL